MYLNKYTYRLNISEYRYNYCKPVHLKDMHVQAAHASCSSFSLLICTTSFYTCSAQVCLGWIVLVH